MLNHEALHRYRAAELERAAREQRLAAEARRARRQTRRRSARSAGTGRDERWTTAA
ncbi:hypothetical protein RM780_07475 [Streptomyces sp. DSM 44917]|uniref:Uncharacterized protein n=1 Tax=Streptomyces boetiae TaxID=3075541 RepID=A0ABU2L614_9ACTN|nr:hypothetical protein [Streptomyces sp. DSM 44917]MDT0306802.1 hypothetical protein [Streptomyces sp. DSM 44917]